MNPIAPLDPTTPPVAAGPAMVAGNPRQRPVGMSYKFQRLREKIRAAIDSGELAGKLPGERSLAKRFHVNAKTLSKALTDLAAEGVLDRSIGRGTYVKGSVPESTALGRWLVLADEKPDPTAASIIQAVQRVNGETIVSAGADPQQMRPSFLNQFSAVIDLARQTPESFLRDLVVRNVPLVAIGREPKTYSMHCVIADTSLATSRLGRDLMLSGHRRLAAVEPAGQSTVAVALRQTAQRCAPDAVVDACHVADLQIMLDDGVTAFICDSPATAAAVRAHLDAKGIAVPGKVSLAAVGCAISDTDAPCSGHYVTANQIVEAATGLLRDAAAITRPAALWLAGGFIDRQTTGPSSSPLEAEAAFQLKTGPGLQA